LFHPDKANDKEAPYYKERMELKERLLMFSKKLKSLRLNAGDISMYENQEITMTKAALRLVSTWMALVVQIPLFLPGMIINSPFYVLGRLIDSYEPYTESVAQDKLIFSFFLALPVYGTLIWLIWKLTGYGLVSLLFVLMMLPLFAWYHMALIDKNYDMLKQVIASWRIFIAITTGTTGVDADWTHSREALEDCVRLRRWCRDQTKQLIYNLSKTGDPQAKYLVEYGKPLFEQLEKQHDE
jgi:glycerol-3-phosphate O-acyltransferase/dihydroxyacetone phosphate acyltransferase